MVPRFLSALDVRLLAERESGRATWMLLAPLRYWSAVLQRDVVVPAGFVTDGESIPRHLAGLTGPSCLHAGVVHDWLYQSHEATKDQADLVYRTEREKFEAILNDIITKQESGRPTLVGTVSIEKSEKLSGMLKRRGVKHVVLNAKYHAQEAEIVAQAGRRASVTIATNMAGRGTDILLGGNPEHMARQQLLAEEIAEKLPKGEEKFVDDEEFVYFFHVDGFYRVPRPDWERVFSHFRRQSETEHDEVVRLGGLHILGTERHEARRIDNQLRGRSGRQGDPGSSRFYLSLEDDLMRRFASERVQGLMRTLGFDDETALESRMVSRTIEGAQTRVEGYNFDTRKHVVQYDDVINRQRGTIYRERDRILRSADLSATVSAMLAEEAAGLGLEEVREQTAAVRGFAPIEAGYRLLSRSEVAIGLLRVARAIRQALEAGFTTEHTRQPAFGRIATDFLSV